MKLAFIGYGDVIINQMVHAKQNGHELTTWIMPQKEIKEGINSELGVNVIAYRDFKQFGANADLFIINECSWLIPSSLFRGIPAINFHAGLLPKWRGYSANLWAIMNNESHIGYSVNIATDELDGGEIVYQYSLKNDFKSFYADIRKPLIEDMAKNLEKIIERFVSGERTKNLNNESFYCVRMNPDFGIINNWNLSAKHIHNLYRIFGHSTATGLYVKKENKTYKVTDLIISDIKSMGVSGAIVYNDEKFIYVNTKDGVIGIDIGERFSNGTLFDGWNFSI